MRALLGLSLLLSAVASPLAAQRPVRLAVVNAAPIPGDTADHMDLHASGQGQFLAQVFDSAGVALKGQKVFWVSGNPGVASVHPLTGRVTARRIGYATIYAATARGLSGSARACVVPTGRTPLNPKVQPNSVKVYTGRTLVPANTLKVADTVTMSLTLELHGRDTTARNIQTWGNCVHWVLNAGPALPILTDTMQIRVSAHGFLRIKCCVTGFYPSATLGTSLQTAVQFFRPSGSPTLRIAEMPTTSGKGWGLLR